MEGDISKKVLIVLIVMALIVSVAGTWIVSERLDVDGIETKKISGTQEGNAGFTLIGEPSKTGESTGNVGFTKIK